MATVLVVDDSAAVTALLRVVLEGAGHRVLEARDGAAGLAVLAASAVDLVVIDMMMPGLDGIETVRRLRGGGNRVPVIAMSGGTDAFPAAYSLKMSEMYGADRLLFKPFKNEELLEAVDQLLAR